MSRPWPGSNTSPKHVRACSDGRAHKPGRCPSACTYACRVGAIPTHGLGWSSCSGNCKLRPQIAMAAGGRGGGASNLGHQRRLALAGAAGCRLPTLAGQDEACAASLQRLEEGTGPFVWFSGSDAATSQGLLRCVLWPLGHVLHVRSTMAWERTRFLIARPFQH